MNKLYFILREGAGDKRRVTAWVIDLYKDQAVWFGRAGRYLENYVFTNGAISEVSNVNVDAKPVSQAEWLLEAKELLDLVKARAIEPTVDEWAARWDLFKKAAIEQDKNRQAARLATRAIGKVVGGIGGAVG